MTSLIHIDVTFFWHFTDLNTNAFLFYIHLFVPSKSSHLLIFCIAEVYSIEYQGLLYILYEKKKAMLRVIFQISNKATECLYIFSILHSFLLIINTIYIVHLYTLIGNATLSKTHSNASSICQIIPPQSSL